MNATGPAGAETVYARKVVLAGGRDGAGAPTRHRFLARARDTAARARIFHSCDSIEFARFRAEASACSAPAPRLSTMPPWRSRPAREVRLFSRRPHLPQVNKSKWTVFPGFFHGYGDLDDARRWQIYTYIFDEAVPPPHESVLRCDRHAGFAIHFAEPWTDVVVVADGVTVVTPKARHQFDAVILATGFSVDLAQRPELAAFTT